MPEIKFSLRTNVASQPDSGTAPAINALSENTRFAISQYLIHLEKNRFFLESVAAGKSLAETELAWQAVRKKSKESAEGKFDASIAKGLAAGVFTGVRK